MNENKLSPELQKIFDEYSVEFWNRLCECRECDIEKAIEIFRDALVDVDKIPNPVRITFCKGEQKMQKVNVYLELEKALMMLHMDWTDIEWSHLRSCCYSLDNKRQEVILRPDHSKEDLGDFQQNIKDMGNYLDISDEQQQQLFGVVVFRNGTWLERRYFDKHWRWHYTYKPEYEAFIKDADERIEAERNNMKQNDKTYTTIANPDDHIYITNNKTGQVTVINRGYEDLP